MMTSRTKRVLGLSSLLTIALLIGCSARVGTAPDGTRFVSFTIGGRAFTFSFGDLGVINTVANQTVKQAGALRLFDRAPADRPPSGRVQLLSSNVRVSPPAGLRAQATPINGTATVRLSIAYGASSDLCDQATLLGQYTIRVTNGVVEIPTETAELSSAALAVIALNDITVCVEMTADFNGVCVMSEFSLVFDESTAGHVDNANGGGDTGGPSGSVAGQVVNAQTGETLNGARVRVTSNGESSLTDAMGRFSLDSVGQGAQMLVTSMDGFVENSTFVVVVAGARTETSIGLVAQVAGGANNVVAVLTWGEQPADLDLHVSGPDGSGGRFHTYYVSRTPVPFACLDLDDRSSFGPETATVSRQAGSGFVPGEYHVWVHNYSGTPGFDVSSATVTLTAGGRQAAQFRIGDASGDPAQTIWQVLEFTLSEDGALSNLRTLQSITTGNAGSVL